METYWTDYGGRKNRILAALYLLLPEERRREIGRKQFETYFKFGFVRNPWDRVVSLYERTEALQLRNEMTFEQFVDWIQYSSATCVHSSPHRYQLDWFVDPNGNVLADFIGKFERLDEDWAFVAQKLGVKEKLPHRRANPRERHYTEYYNSRTRDVIATSSKWISSVSAMSFPNKIKAIVLTCDRYRAITRHLIFKYDRLWPDHPFVFHIPYQELGGTDTQRVKYFTSPSDIKGTVLHLLAEIDDEEWIYWCVDDKYPIQLPTDKVASLISHAMRSPGIDGLLFCRCRATLSSPWFTLHPHKTKNLFGDVYLERKPGPKYGFIRSCARKCSGTFFNHLPDHIPKRESNG